MDLNGKNLVYLGGFGGIGRECLKEFLAKGIKNVAILDLNENTAYLEELKKTYPNANIFYIKLDITDKSSIEAAYKEAAAKIGHFDVVVNGCGIMDDRHIELTIQINFLGLIQSTLTAVTYMDKSNGGQGGVIVNISSVVGLEPAGMLAVYSASKHGVTGFTRSMGNPVYYKHTGVAFLTICPGLTDTTLLDTPGIKATLKCGAPLAQRFDVIKVQSPQVCARNLVKAVELMKNGAVWLLDVGEMKEVEFPELWVPQLK